MAMFGTLCLIPIFQEKSERSFFKILGSVLLGIMFYYAAYKSGARTGLVMGVFLLMAFIVLRSRILTITGYVVAITTLIAVIFSAEHIVTHRLHTQFQDFLYEVLPISRADNRIFVFGTLTIRFESLAGIANGDHLFPFGAIASGESEYRETARIHEVLSGFLVSFGYVPFLLILGVATPILIKVHRILWDLKWFPTAQKLAVFGLANYFSVFFGGLSAGSNFATFPITYFLYLFGGMSLAAIAFSSEKKQQEKRLLDSTNRNLIGKEVIPLVQGSARITV